MTRAPRAASGCTAENSRTATAPQPVRRNQCCHGLWSCSRRGSWPNITEHRETSTGVGNHREHGTEPAGFSNRTPDSTHEATINRDEQTVVQRAVTTTLRDRVRRPPAQARRPWSRSRISYQLNHELPGLVSRHASPPTIPSSPPPTRSEQDSQQAVEQETTPSVTRPESPVVRRVRFLPKSKQGAGNDRKHGGKQPWQQFGELDLWELLKNVPIEMTAAQPIAAGA